jgi:mannose-1-phosphate guanylyltransferase/mannose-6-phosphate isomerase
LGTWDAVWEHGTKDGRGNVFHGDTLLENTTDTFVYSNHRLVSAVGVDNLVIIETADAVLVANKDLSQDVKKIVSKLEKMDRDERVLHRKVSRPWGWFDAIDIGDRFKVKRILVNPGSSLSLQKHSKRAEHWVVVRGFAEVTCDKKIIHLRENESTFIPQGVVHRLANIGSEPLEIIEVQSGIYLGEDDIVRIDDDYGRNREDN